MKHAFSKIEFPDGHETTRVFRWRGVDSNVVALVGATVARGGTFTIRGATPAEVAASEARRAVVNGQAAAEKRDHQLQEVHP